MAQAQGLRVHQFARADLLLWCRSADTADPPAVERALEPMRIDVWTKADREEPRQARQAAVVTSATTGLGLDALRSAIARALRNQRAEDHGAAATGARCRGSFQCARTALLRAAEALAVGAGDELVVCDLRSAVDELGKVVGAVFTDDVLDRIFRRFCIGK
jgi:tRNA modification GTPase